MSRIYLTNQTADVTGYLAAYVNSRRPNTTALTLSSTASTAAGDGIQLTDSTGVTNLAWITKPFAAAVTITSALVYNIWCRETAAFANVSLGISLYEYTTSEQSTFWSHSPSAELGTATIARLVGATTTGTATTIDAGNRLVIKIFMDNTSGGMAGGSGALVDFDGPTEGVDGDTFIDFNEAITVSEVQSGNGTLPPQPGFGQGFYQDLIDKLNAACGANLITSTNAIATLIDELELQRDQL